jgi:DNA-directed RNA polymerase subunit D
MTDAERKAARAEEECDANMKIEVLSQDDKNLRFVIEGITPTFLNTIRRTAVVEVPTMAIEEVDFTKNSSVLYDEIIAQRLGLIPLTTDLKTYNVPAECKCKGKGCSSCQAKFTLNAKGPKIVYSGDLKPKDPKIKPVYDDIPITKLTENQDIKFTATAVLGYGKEHTKWSTSNFVFQGYPDIVIQPGKHKDAAEIVNSCPRNVLEDKEGAVKVKNIEACNLCKACEKVNAEEIKVNGLKDKFIVTIESWGQLSPKEIMDAAADSLAVKLKEFEKLVK